MSDSMSDSMIGGILVAIIIDALFVAGAYFTYVLLSKSH